MTVTNTEEKKERKILKNKVYLYLTEFFAGMSVMAVELGASRLLAPYFSSSQIVWTIIIGTIMIAMALGNLYGGRSADKNPDPDKLYARILIAAIWIAAIPVVGRYIVIAVAGLVIFTVNSNYLVIAGFVTCMIVFVFPLFLLGTVTPSLVKYSVDSLDESGSTVGRLGAFNTIGSIIGTFVPTFISIPAVGTSVTFLIFAGILLVLAVIYFMSTKLPVNKIKKVPVSIALFLICCVLGHDTSFAFWQNDLTYEGESIYNYLQVYENPREIVLSTNVLFGVQSVYRKEQSLTGMYYDYAMAAPLMTDTLETARDAYKAYDMSDTRMLILGMGTGTYATQCRRYLGDMDIEGVEIDDKITMLAGEYFELPQDIPVTTYDGRAYLNAIDGMYDVIMVDAYQDITIPFQMSSVEFFTLVRQHLKPDGVMVVNMNMRGSGEDNINDYLSDTIASVFSEVYTVDVAGSTNRELFASDNPVMSENLTRNIAKLTASDSSSLAANDDLVTMMQRVKNNLVRYEAGNRILTDDKAPVELLGMRVIDEIIRDELEGIDSIDDVMSML